MACIYQDFYEYKSTNNYLLMAARIFGALSRKDDEHDCLLNAMSGSIITNNKQQADSLLDVCNKYEPLTDQQQHTYKSSILSYAIEYGTQQEIKDATSRLLSSDSLTTDDLLKLARAYNKLGQYNLTHQILDVVKQCGQEYDTLKYNTVSVRLYKNEGDFEKALSSYIDFTRKTDSLTVIKYEQQLKTIKEKFEIEMQAIEDSKEKTGIIWKCIIGIVFLVLGTIMLLLVVRSNRIKRDLALRQAEILSNRIVALEIESEKLKSLIESHNNLPLEVQHTIQERIEMLNSMLAGYITGNEQYEKQYDAWRKSPIIRKNL